MSSLFSPPNDCLPQFDQLSVVSDLHLGGLSGFQIFNAGEMFRAFVDQLRKGDPTQKIALLINGDLVDFLAESPAAAFDPAGAVTKLTRIGTDPAFAPVWKGLTDFVATPNRFLLINLGNHDLELALPWVREKLLTMLAGQDDAARGCIHLAFDGTGIRCRVGTAEILALHGNEVDDWNVTDYEHLRRLGRDIMLGKPIENWIPNAGSQLVVDVMNTLKRRFPFIDLLKPEGPAVVPTLLALAPDQRDKLMSIASVASRLSWDKFRRSVGWLGQADPSSALGTDTLVGNSNLTNAFGMGMSDPAFKRKLLRLTEKRFNEGIDPMTLIAQNQPGNYLGMAGAIANWFSGAEPAEVLREALEKLQHDHSFEYDDEDETFRRLDEQVGSGPTFVVAGHTHLARALPRKQGNGWYFNSGTWVRLIRLTPDVLTNPARFKEVFAAFKAGDMSTLDSTKDLVHQQLTVVSFWVEDSRTFGELRHVVVQDGYVANPKSSTGKMKPAHKIIKVVSLASIPGTRFPQQ